MDTRDLNNYDSVAAYLIEIFDLLNKEYFESALSKPTITIQSTPKAYGHFSLQDDTWVSTLGKTHEINIGAGTLARPIEKVVATMVHEMCHYYNYMHGIKDCSRGNTYHNKKFKKCAEEHGLIVERTQSKGWNRTSPSGKLIEFVKEKSLTDILLYRNEGWRDPGNATPGTDSEKPRTKRSSTRKYICPQCGNSVRATKEINLLCGDCMLRMEPEEKG